GGAAAALVEGLDWRGADDLQFAAIHFQPVEGVLADLSGGTAIDLDARAGVRADVVLLDQGTCAGIDLDAWAVGEGDVVLLHQAVVARHHDPWSAVIPDHVILDER